jgi:two-component system chemotaxis sensor kinase CheA
MTNYEELFISEAEEYLEQVSDSILKLEKDMNDIEAINSIFRGMHTIKGMAASMGYSSITKISHSIEDVMDLIRNEKLQVSTELIDLLLKGTDYIQSLVHKKDVDENIIKSFLKVIESIKTGSEIVKETKKIEEVKTKKIPIEKVSLSSEKAIKIIFSEDVVLKSARAFVVIKNLQDRNIFIKSDPDFDSIMK